MITWIILGIVAYIIVGVVLLVLACRDPWGALVLEIWYLVLLLWPFMLIQAFINRFK